MMALRVFLAALSLILCCSVAAEDKKQYPWTFRVSPSCPEPPKTCGLTLYLTKVFSITVTWRDGSTTREVFNPAIEADQYSPSGIPMLPAEALGLSQKALRHMEQMIVVGYALAPPPFTAITVSFTTTKEVGHSNMMLIKS